MQHADHQETAPDSQTLVITRLVCSLRGAEQVVHITPGSLTFKAYGRLEVTERFSCNYGVNENYRADIFGNDLRVVGQDEEGKVRIVERPSHPFFVATLFTPQLSSEPGRPHPLILAFLRAAALRAREGSVGQYPPSDA
jgi:CTP synthase (UTP-ammonia lyase)